MNMFVEKDRINRYIVGCKLTKYYKDTLNGAVWR